MIDLIYSLFRGIASIIGAEQGLIDMWEAIRDFMELGGDVLVLIAVLMVVMWVLIKACVALCPLLGLLGTVTGMIEVFEVMALMGTGNARAMAAGVSKATVPTMCGMVAALSGLFLSVWLQRKAESEVQVLGEHMTMDH